MRALPMIGMIPMVSMRNAHVNAYGTPIIGKRESDDTANYAGKNIIDVKGWYIELR